MVNPLTFAIHVTYTCPLACAHCCFSSSPRNTDRLDPELVLEAIRRLDAPTIKLVAFTGGEPFLLGADLPRLVREASSRGFGTRIVTSAYFGTTACKRLFENPAIEAILDEALAERAAEVFGEFCLLESLGVAEPVKVMTLWSDTMMLVPN